MSLYDNILCQHKLLTEHLGVKRIRLVAGFSMGGALALRLSQIRGSEIAGTILVNASIYDERKRFKLVPALSLFLPSIPGGPGDVAKQCAPQHGYKEIPLRGLNQLRKLWEVVERDLYLVDLPLMVSYSINDHVVHPVCSETIIDNVYSADIREVVFEKSFHNVALDHDADLLNEESMDFILDVLSGELSRGESIYESDERELIDAEFDSIVSTLSLDQSAPTTYLDQLDAIDDSERFVAPDPILPRIKERAIKIAVMALIAGPIWIFASAVLGFDPFGVEPWPGLLATTGGLATLLYRWNLTREEGEDGAHI
jgi:esterase/lipase